MAGKGKRGPAPGSKPKPHTVGANIGNAGKGRPKGIPNKATKNAREAISAFVDNQAPRLERLLDRIEAENGPKAAFDCIVDVLEFGVPKLARTEVTGANGGPQNINVNLKLVKSGQASQDDDRIAIDRNATKPRVEITE